MKDVCVYETFVRSDFLMDMKFVAKVYGVELEILNEETLVCAGGETKDFVSIRVSGEGKSLVEFTQMWLHKKYSLLNED